MNVDEFGFELNVGSLCNFKCRYCFESNIPYVPSKVDIEYLDRYSEYIHFLKKEYYRDSLFGIKIFGGEPLLQYDSVEHFIFKIKDVVNSIRIISNGYCINEYKEKLLKLKQLCKDEGIFLSFGVSYDFINQDYMRQKNSSAVVLDAIKWLYNNGFNSNIYTVFTNENIYTFSKVFFEYIKLKCEMPNMNCSFAVDRSKPLYNIDFDKLRIELLKVKTYLINHNIQNCFFHRSAYGIYRKNSSFDNCFYGDIFVGMNYDGSLYPGYDVPYESKTVQDMFYIGHITEDFKTLEEKRLSMIRNRPTNIKDVCKECNVLCRVHPWKIIKNDISEWWDIPEGQHCELHKLIGEYF